MKLNSDIDLEKSLDLAQMEPILYCQFVTVGAQQQPAESVPNLPYVAQ
jgi:hypothetical protein